MKHIFCLLQNKCCGVMIVSGGKNMHDALIYTMVLNDYQINVYLHGPSMPEKKHQPFLKPRVLNTIDRHVCTYITLIKVKYLLEWCLYALQLYECPVNMLISIFQIKTITLLSYCCLVVFTIIQFNSVFEFLGSQQKQNNTLLSAWYYVCTYTMYMILYH